MRPLFLVFPGLESGVDITSCQRSILLSDRGSKLLSVNNYALGFLIDVHVFGGTLFRGTVIWRILICGIGLLDTLSAEIYELGDE